MYLYWIHRHSYLACVMGVTVEIEIDTGKRLIIKLETISEPDENGKRTIYCYEWSSKTYLYSR